MLHSLSQKPVVVSLITTITAPSTYTPLDHPRIASTRRARRSARAKEKERNTRNQKNKMALSSLLAVAPVLLIEESWVQCDNPDCKKWRKLPSGSQAPAEDAPW